MPLFQHTMMAMHDFSLKMENATDFIERALSDFLRDKKLQLTDQQYEKLKKLLMVRLMDEELSYASAYNQLSELIEYRTDYEIGANAPDEAEEEMIRIIGAADDALVVAAPIETNRFKKRFIITASLLALLIGGLLSAQGVSYLRDNAAKEAAVITRAEETQLKELVAQVVELEKSQGNAITSASVYNEIKKLESIQSHGEATSYKKFNHAQYIAAIEYLNDRLLRYSVIEN